MSHARRFLLVFGCGLMAVAHAADAQRVQLVATAAGRTIDLGATVPPARIDSGVGVLAAALRWSAVREGVQMARVELRAGTLGTAVQAVVVRVDPSRLRFALQHLTAENGMTGRWTLDSVAPRAVLAMNAGQFKETGPWGWLVLDGYEQRNPASAPLGVGICIDSAGRLQWIPPGRENAARHDAATIYAFQSFPLLAFNRRVPSVLRDRTRIDMTHRDARLVLAELNDGSVLFVLTRYAALGALGARVPIGLTTPETIVLVAALGARHAVMLDGGTSAQLLLRDGTGAETRWPGLRRVPLGLVAHPR